MRPTSPISPCQPKFTARGSLDSLTPSFRPISRGSQASIPQSLHGHHPTKIYYPPEFSNGGNDGRSTGSERGSGNGTGNNGGGGAPSRGGTGGQEGSGRGGGSNEGGDSGSDTNNGFGNDDDSEASSSQSGGTDEDDREANDGNDQPGKRKSSRFLWRGRKHVNGQSLSTRFHTEDAQKGGGRGMAEDQDGRHMAPTKHALKRMSGKTAAWIAKGKAKVNGHI